MSEANKFQSLDIAYDSARDKLKFQSEQWNSIDQKNAVVLAVYGIILAVFLAGGILDVFPRMSLSEVLEEYGECAKT